MRVPMIPVFVQKLNLEPVEVFQLPQFAQELLEDSLFEVWPPQDSPLEVLQPRLQLPLFQ